MSIYALGPAQPRIHRTAFVHPAATVIGDVEVGAEATVWPGAVLRGDSNRIAVGARTSIQDGTVVHCSETHETVIGVRCVVGHNAYLEGCVVEPDCLIGSASSILADALLERGCAVGAGAVVTGGTRVPAGALALGVPARIRRDAVSAGFQAETVEMYAAKARQYATELRRLP